MKRHRPRIFVGLYEIGHVTLYLSRGLRELGYKVTNVVRELNSPLREREYCHDRYLRLSGNRYIRGLKILFEFLRQLPSHEVFVLNRTESFFSYLRRSAPNWLQLFSYFDLWLLNRFRKKIIVIASGSDIRSERLLIQEMEEEGLHHHVNYVSNDLLINNFRSDDVKRKHISQIEKYTDHIFTRPIHAQLLSKDFHLLWLPIDLRTVEFTIPQGDPPLVIHAPSNPRIKGTKYILEAVERLRAEGYRFHFELCENMSNLDVRRKLTQSCIAIDQLILPGYGLFAIEAMASGNAVLGSAIPGYNGFPYDMPVMTTTPDSLYQHLKKVLGSPQLRTDLSIRGRKYVEKYHDYKVVARNFIEAIGELT